MQDERRRFFRINETVDIAYHVLEEEGGASADDSAEARSDVLDLVSKQDQQIEKLLLELTDEHPKVVELVTVFNQKLERIVNQLVVESRLVGRIAHRVKEANISACGVAFENDESIIEGARLKLELTLYPGEQTIMCNGIVVGCDPVEENWYWRIDFYGMEERQQEKLIQHVVQAQSYQLNKKFDD